MYQLSLDIQHSLFYAPPQDRYTAPLLLLIWNLNILSFVVDALGNETSLEVGAAALLLAPSA